MKFPCEITVWKVLPAIKCQMAIKMKDKGLSQKEISGILQVTEAAVSQYLSGKRANDFELKELDNELDDSVDRIIENPKIFVNEVCDICKKVRTKGLLCKNCMELGTLEGCSVCKEVKK